MPEGIKTWMKGWNKGRRKRNSIELVPLCRGMDALANTFMLLIYIVHILQFVRRWGGGRRKD
jgi:hypothetical protein